MTEQEERTQVEGTLYLLEEFIKEVIVPNMRVPRGERIPREVTAFIANMRTREANFRTAHALPQRFNGRHPNSVCSGMEIGCDFLEGVFLE